MTSNVDHERPSERAKPACEGPTPWACWVSLSSRLRFFRWRLLAGHADRGHNRQPGNNSSVQGITGDQNRCPPRDLYNGELANALAEYRIRIDPPFLVEKSRNISFELARFQHHFHCTVGITGDLLFGKQLIGSSALVHFVHGVGPNQTRRVRRASCDQKQEHGNPRSAHG